MPTTARAIICFIGYICMHGGMSFTTNAYYGLGPMLAGSNPTDRFRLSSRGAQFMSAAMLLTSAILIPLIEWLTPHVGVNS